MKPFESVEETANSGWLEFHPPANGGSKSCTYFTVSLEYLEPTQLKL